MKKALLIFVIGLCSTIALSLPGEGLGWEEWTVNCVYECPDGGMTIQATDCRSGWFSSCWRTLCPKLTNVCF